MRASRHPSPKLGLLSILLATSSAAMGGCVSPGSSGPSQGCRDAVRVAGQSLTSFVSVTDARSKHLAALDECKSWFAKHSSCEAVILTGLDIISAVERQDRAEASRRASGMDALITVCNSQG